MHAQAWAKGMRLVHIYQAKHKFLQYKYKIYYSILGWFYSDLIIIYYLVERKTKSYKINLFTYYTYAIKTAIKQKCI